MTTRLLHVFWDVDMRARHEGLTMLAKKEGLDVKKLKPGEMCCFLNRKQDRLMVLAGVNEEDTYGVLGYYRSPHGRLDQMAIQYIPEAFGSEGLDMKAAIRKALEARIKPKRQVVAGA